MLLPQQVAVGVGGTLCAAKDIGVQVADDAIADACKTPLRTTEIIGLLLAAEVIDMHQLAGLVVDTVNGAAVNLLFDPFKLAVVVIAAADCTRDADRLVGGVVTKLEVTGADDIATAVVTKMAQPRMAAVIALAELVEAVVAQANSAIAQGFAAQIAQCIVDKTPAAPGAAGAH